MLPVRPDISSLSSSDDDADTTRQREEYDEHMLPRALPVTDFPKVNDRSDKGVAVYEHDGLLENVSLNTWKQCNTNYHRRCRKHIYSVSLSSSSSLPLLSLLSLFLLSLNRRCAFNKCARAYCVCES